MSRNHLHLTDEQVLELVDLGDMTDELVLAYGDLGSGTAVSTVRVRAQLEDLDASAMSAYYPRREVGGGKLYVNGPRGRGFLIALFDDGGQLLASMAGEALTAARTAATTAVGIRALAPSGARTAALFGTGAQAPWQARVLASELDLEELRIVGRRRERVDALVAQLGAEGIAAHATDARDAVGTVTATVEPLFDGAWLEPTALVVGVGSTKPHRQELDLETVRRATFVVTDSSSGAQAEAGDLVHAVEAGDFHWHRLVGVEEVLAGTTRVPSEAGIRLFETQGLALQDVVGAWSVYHRASTSGDRDRTT